MLPVEEVWGIGRTYRKKMQALQIVTAKDLVNKEESLVKKALNTRGWQTWQELNHLRKQLSAGAGKWISKKWLPTIE